jgi:class 3 adenylate cyclase
MDADFRPANPAQIRLQRRYFADATRSQWTGLLRTITLTGPNFIGINTGLVVAGEIGGRDRRDRSVMGDAVNLAARLEDASRLCLQGR